MEPEQIFIGMATCAICLLGIYHGRWFLVSTRKGRRLVAWFGARKALWVLRGLLLCGAIFGSLLATGIVNPVRW